MVETAEGGGRFAKVTLHPAVKLAAGADSGLAMKLHDKAHRLCFIANSVNFPVVCEPAIEGS
jgi:organic hydroperoxide reductase OsmC/OhrA